MRIWRTVEHIHCSLFLKNQPCSTLEDWPLDPPITLRRTKDPKKPQFEPRYEGLYIKLGELAPRQLAVVTGYCVYEKKKNREIKNPKQIKLKNGRPAIKGTCASCGKQIFRIGKLK